MVDQSLKAIILMRHQPLLQEVGVISNELSEKLIEYASTHSGNIAQSIKNRSDQATNKDDQKLRYDISEFYDQVYIEDQSLVDQLILESGIEISSIRVGVLQPGAVLDWHIDYEPCLRVHIDLSVDSDFHYRIGKEYTTLKKKRLTVYKLNASHYHKVENPTNKVRYALIGNFVDEV